MVDGTPIVVIDNGSDSIKAGFAGDEAPHICFPTVGGTGKDFPDVLIGERAM